MPVENSIEICKQALKEIAKNTEVSRMTLRIEGVMIGLAISIFIALIMGM